MRLPLNWEGEEEETEEEKEGEEEEEEKPSSVPHSSEVSEMAELKCTHSVSKQTNKQRELSYVSTNWNTIKFNHIGWVALIYM